MKPFRAVLVAALATAATLMVAPAAHAAGGSTSSQSGVLFECAPHPYAYSIDLPPNTEGLSMDVSVRGPDGLQAGSDYIYDVDPPLTRTGTGDIQLCSSDLPGTYTVTAMVDSFDTNYQHTMFALPNSTFAMRQPYTKTALSAKPKDAKPGQVVKFKVTTTEERPAGYFPNVYTSVHLEQYTNGQWKRIRKASGTTDGSGRETISVKYSKGRIKVRAVTEASTEDPESISSTVVVR